MENKASYVCFECGKKHLTKEEIEQRRNSEKMQGDKSSCFTFLILMET